MLIMYSFKGVVLLTKSMQLKLLRRSLGWTRDTCLAENFDAATLEADLTSDSEFSRFKEAAKHSNLVPLYERVFADQLTPVTAYRCLVAEDDREAPSFLFESVVNGTQTVSASTSILDPKSCPREWQADSVPYGYLPEGVDHGTRAVVQLSASQYTLCQHNCPSRLSVPIRRKGKLHSIFCFGAC